MNTQVYEHGRRMASLTFLLGVCGLVLSMYALHVEHMVEASQASGVHYEALCDIQSIGASCSSVFTSEWGKLMSHLGLVPKDSPLDLPNAVYGAIYYVVVLIHSFLPKGEAVLLVSTVGAVASTAVLAYVLAFVLHDICVVCMSTYVVNISLLTIVVRRAWAAPVKDKGS